MTLLACMEQVWHAILRILRLRAPQMAQNSVVAVQEKSSLSITDHVVTAAERVGHVPELVENTLRFAGPQTQICLAWKVSPLWRDKIVHVVKTSNDLHSFRHPFPCGAAEQGEQRDLDPSLRFLEPSDEEFESYYNELLLLCGIKDSPGEHRCSWPYVCSPHWPAQIRASKALPSHMAQTEDDLRGRWNASNLHYICGAP